MWIWRSKSWKRRPIKELKSRFVDRNRESKIWHAFKVTSSIEYMTCKYSIHDFDRTIGCVYSPILQKIVKKKCKKKIRYLYECSFKVPAFWFHDSSFWTNESFHLYKRKKRKYLNHDDVLLKFIYVFYRNDHLCSPALGCWNVIPQD